AMERRDWYACRWMVEEFHRIEKSGCGEEDRRFATASRMQACLAILSLVAVRVFQLWTALDNIPEEPATTVATNDDLVVLNEMQPTNKRVVTVRDFVLAVGRLGGHLGRKSDGPPGTRTLWQGYQRLQDFVLGYQIRLRKQQGDVGKR
ncbi:IS4 family transposase, partial [Mycobacterium sp.]|uniref:IS4 family transposase n=1 Tax=Mycobacterium sp. TaxID=1785 RepID=UPI003A840DD4